MVSLPAGAPAAVRAIAGGWQLNGIATHNYGTPFTVSDSANVALQRQPADSGSRPVAERGRRSERGPAHRQRVVEPLRVSTAERAHAGGAVRQRRPQHRARTVLHDVDMSLVRDFQLPHGRGCSSAPRSSTSRTRPTSGCGRGPQLGELRADLLCSAAAADAVGLKLIFYLLTRRNRRVRSGEGSSSKLSKAPSILRPSTLRVERQAARVPVYETRSRPLASPLQGRVKWLYAAPVPGTRIPQTLSPVGRRRRGARPVSFDPVRAFGSTLRMRASARQARRCRT